MLFQLGSSYNAEQDGKIITNVEWVRIYKEEVRLWQLFYIQSK